MNMSPHTHIWIMLLPLLSIGQAKAQLDTAVAPIGCILQIDGGRSITVQRFWRIGETSIEYEDGTGLHDLAVERIRSIRCGGKDHMISAGAVITQDHHVMHLLDTLSGQDLEMSLFQLGKRDAKEHYRGTGAFVAGLLTTPTLLGPFIVAAIPPHSNRKNPNNALYREEKQYRKGFRKVAHGRKAGLVLAGFVSGILILSLMK